MSTCLGLFLLFFQPQQAQALLLGHRRRVVMVAVTGVHSHPPITQLLEQWFGVLFVLPNHSVVV
jgi:hypothetical protein